MILWPGYLNSILSLVQFGVAEIFEVDDAHDDSLLCAVFNLRSEYALCEDDRYGGKASQRPSLPPLSQIPSGIPT